MEYYELRINPRHNFFVRSRKILKLPSNMDTLVCLMNPPETVYQLLNAGLGQTSQKELPGS